MNKSVLQSVGLMIAGIAIVSAPVYALAHNDGANASEKNNDATTVSISDNGSVLVRGAEVTAVNGNAITTRTEWGSLSLTWVLDTDADTDFVREKGSDADLGDISVGDTLSFSGALDTTASPFRINVDTVRDWSLDDKVSNHDSHGKVHSVWSEIRNRFPSISFFAHAKSGKDNH